MATTVESETETSLRSKLDELKFEHRDLDEIITGMAADLSVDDLKLRRFKKRKLMLKDHISRIESELIPDLNA